MELLLRKDVEGLGACGEIVIVARGYARNYLLPQGLAQIPSEQAVAEVRATGEKMAEIRAVEKTEKMIVAKSLAEVVLTIPMRASKEGSLYGSVGARQIMESLAEAGHEVEEKQVLLDQPIKQVGDHEVTISLHAEVQVPIKVTIQNEEEPRRIVLGVVACGGGRGYNSAGRFSDGHFSRG